MGNKFAKNKQRQQAQTSLHPPKSLDTTATAASAATHEVLSKLLADNATYIAGSSPLQSTLSSAAVRQRLAADGQAPVAAVVTCADSRVPPEVIFSAGIGHLFVIRNAGNTVNADSTVGSLEYAVSALNVPLVIIMGHTECGAIKAAVGAIEASDAPPNPDTPLMRHVSHIADVVRPTVSSGSGVLKDSILANVRHGVSELRAPSSPLGGPYAAGRVHIAGAIYDIHSGQVFTVDP